MERKPNEPRYKKDEVMEQFQATMKTIMASFYEKSN